MSEITYIKKPFTGGKSNSSSFRKSEVLTGALPRNPLSQIGSKLGNQATQQFMKTMDIEKQWSAINSPGDFTEYNNGHVLLWNFDIAKANLKPEHIKKLERIIEIWKVAILNPAAYISVIGHASNTGNHQLNEQISEMRAEAAKNYLTDHNVETNRIKIESCGDREPLASEPLFLGKGMAENRSVEIKIVGLGKQPPKEKKNPFPEPNPSYDHIVENVVKFVEATEPQDKLSELMEKVIIPPGISELIPTTEIFEWIDTAITPLHVVIGTEKAQTVNSRYALVAAIAYTFISYAMYRKVPESLPPDFPSLEPESLNKWRDVCAKAWLSIDVDAKNDPNWSKIELYIRNNPEKVLNEVYRKASKEYDLGPLLEVHQKWWIKKE